MTTFSFFLVINKQNFSIFLPFHPREILTTFFLKSFPPFLRCFTPSKRCRYNCTTNFFHHSFSKLHLFQHSFLRFSTVPVQNLQLQLHNSHFTTANYILQLHKLSSVAR